MLYLDTSIVVAALTNEPRSAEIHEWLERTHDPLSVSHWVLTEFAAALSIKVRMGKLTEPDRTASSRRFDLLLAETFEVMPVLAEDFRRAATFTARHDLGLRGGDALHLAIAHAGGAELVTLDKRLAQAGEALGVPARLL